MHTYFFKAEDIINLGGAPLAVQLFGSDDEGELAEGRGVLFSWLAFVTVLPRARNCVFPQVKASRCGRVSGMRSGAKAGKF